MTGGAFPPRVPEESAAFSAPSVRDKAAVLSEKRWYAQGGLHPGVGLKAYEARRASLGLHTPCTRPVRHLLAIDSLIPDSYGRSPLR